MLKQKENENYVLQYWGINYKKRGQKTSMKRIFSFTETVTSFITSLLIL